MNIMKKIIIIKYGIPRVLYPWNTLDFLILQKIKVFLEIFEKDIWTLQNPFPSLLKHPSPLAWQVKMVPMFQVTGCQPSVKTLPAILF